ncbi:MAG: hypothetical protein ACK55O_04445 [Phycisphaerales bacterium]
MQHPTNHIFAFTPETLRAWFEQRHLEAYRADQVLEWVYEKRVIDPAKMSNISKRCREVLAAEMTFLSGVTVADRLASDGTHKLLIQWTDVDAAAAAPAALGDEGDGQGVRVALPMLGAEASDGEPVAPDTSRQTECVMIPSESDAGPRRTACISSQVGCPVGCKFCASGLGGLDGNLSTGRIVEQVWRLGGLPDVRRISNVVFMGMGEPLSNFQNVVGAIRIMNGLWGLGISARKITISTVGLPAAIEKLARELELPVTLAEPARPDGRDPPSAHPVGELHHDQGPSGRVRFLLPHDRARDHARVHAAARCQRPPAARARTGPPGADASCECEPHSIQRSCRNRVQSAEDRRCARVSGDPAAVQHQRAHPRQPRPRHRRGVRAVAA